MRRPLIALLLMAVACGPVRAQPAISPLAAATARPSAAAPAVPSPSPITSPSPSSLPAPGTSPSLLFAALEAKGTAGWDTVVIAGLDGYARAKTTFTPMRVPTVGCTGKAVLPVSAHVAAGKA